uniref:alcohol dehydrogenase n=1 Tax=Panagrellus redivivus TaxID=6233 RepID=A0A7E4VQ64_PANRE
MAENVPSTQKAAIFDTVGGPIEVRDIPVPEPSAEEILVKILYSGVCHTDLHVWLGDFPVETKGPLVGGHEGAGIVVKVGKNVTNFKVGDRAGIKWVNRTCLSCEYCKRGYEPNCETAINSGLGINGTFQQYALTKGSEAAKIPDNVDLIKAAPILCAGVTVYRALKESNVQPGQIVAITGAGGGLGSLAIQYAKAMGFRILAIDIGDAKEAHCKSLGAEFYVDVSKTNDIVQTITKVTDGGPHGVVNIATAEKPIELATQYVRTRGTVVLVSLPKDAQLKADVFWTVFRAVTIKGSYVGNRQDTDEALDFLARGLVDVPIEVLPLSALPSIYDRMLKGQITGRTVLDVWK